MKSTRLGGTGATKGRGSASPCFRLSPPPTAVPKTESLTIAPTAFA